MKTYKMMVAFTLIFISACGGKGLSENEISALQTSAVETIFAGATITATTSIPTSTPAPTNTPIPTPTNTPTPNPIVLNGQGDNVIDFQKWDGPALAHVTNTGSGNFIVYSYDSSGNMIDLLVNVIGNYDGTIPLDFNDNERAARMEIKSDGQWVVEIYPISIQYIKIMDVPGEYYGKGDDVVFLKNTPDTAEFNTSASGNFIVLAYGEYQIDLAVNEIAPYNGKVALNKDVLILVVKSTGEWHVSITGR